MVRTKKNLKTKPDESNGFFFSYKKRHIYFQFNILSLILEESKEPEKVILIENEVKEEAQIIDDKIETDNLSGQSGAALNDQNEEATRIQKIKMLFSYAFFISICLAYFLVSLVKTIYSDWSLMYLNRRIKVNPYDGNCSFVSFYMP